MAPAFKPAPDLFKNSFVNVEGQLRCRACAVNLFLNVDKARAGDYAGRGKSSGTPRRITNPAFADRGKMEVSR